MPFDDTSIENLELARTLGVSRSLLRFWEEEFELPRRDDGRLTPLEADEVYLIYDLIETKGLPLQDAKVAFFIERKRLEMKYKTINKLKDIRASLTRLKSELDVEKSQS
jgi:DNA-binding transcriptional MerR regulator